MGDSDLTHIIDEAEHHLSYLERARSVIPDDISCKALLVAVWELTIKDSRRRFSHRRYHRGSSGGISRTEVARLQIDAIKWLRGDLPDEDLAWRDETAEYLGLSESTMREMHTRSMYLRVKNSWRRSTVNVPKKSKKVGDK